MHGRWTRVLSNVLFVASVVVLVHNAVAFAQATGDGPTSVVMTSPVDEGRGPWGVVGDISWPAAAYGVVNRFLTVLERMVTDTRGWLDRWLDKTNGRLKIDYRKTSVNAGYVENDPDRTGEVPQHLRRRSTDRRNGTAPVDDDEPT